MAHASTCDCRLLYAPGYEDMTFCVQCGFSQYYDIEISLCVQCPANSKTSSSGGIGIDMCDRYPGYGDNNWDNTCSVCPIETYSDALGEGQYCYSCNGANSTSLEGSDDVSDCVCGLGVSGFDCSSCVLDTYKNFLGNGTCVGGNSWEVWGRAIGPMVHIW